MKSWFNSKAVTEENGKRIFSLMYFKVVSPKHFNDKVDGDFYFKQNKS